MKTNVITQVYELPEDPIMRATFVEGVRKLALECKASWLAGSVHDEIAYSDLLAKELADEVGEMSVEMLRNNFEAGLVS